jgi:DEAD/DEAH box helicase domain-containing protein
MANQQDRPAGRANRTGSAPGHASGGARRARKGRGIEGIVQGLRGDPELKDAFSHWHEEEARAGVRAEFPAGLDRRLVELWAERGVTAPHAHQARAIELALEGKDVLVATPTASGKTLCYTAPVLQSLIESDGAARALFLFPTKALSQDQSATFNALIEALGEDWHSFTYDGDTPPSVRRTLRERGQVVLTNPWMLHQGILPNHGKWVSLFRGLEWIVIDEVHTLSGVFGSSVANVLRRLVRLARHYGANPRFLLCSATLREPAEHARRLVGREVAVVDEDASPAGARTFAVYQPPLVDAVAGLRKNALEEARRLAKHVVGPDHQTIFFCNRRTSVEVLTRYLKEAAGELGLRPDEIRGYRGGYLPLLRREVESGLRSGEVKVVVTTNALELGIDVGSLDVAVLVGYPGSQASFWQRIGRAGRRGKPSLAVMIARSDPIDQFLALHPDWLFGAPRERIEVDADNLVILSEQLKCAAFELPFRDESEGSGPVSAGSVGAYGDSPDVPGILDYLADEVGILQHSDDAWYWIADAYPAQDVTLAGNEPDNVIVLDSETEKALGEVDREASLTTCHEGAIYQVEGETWKIERFDHANRRAYAKRVATDYFTEAETNTEVRVLRLEERSARPRMDGAGCEDHSVWHGEVHVTTVPTLYKKVRFYTRESIGADEIDLPEEELDTEAFVLTISEETAADLELHRGDRSAAWRAAGELVRRVAPLFLRCQPSDLGLSSQSKSGHFERPALFLFDRVMGGVGLARGFFAEHRAIVRAALDVVAGCACPSGCPACVGPRSDVGARGKATVVALLEHLLEGPAPEPVQVEDPVPVEAEPEG